MGYYSARVNSVLKLGRRTPAVPKKVRKLAEFLRGTVPPPPVSTDWAKAVRSWPMMLNDQLGCCVISCIGHQIGTFTANESGSEVLVSDTDVLQQYERVGGYRPNQPWTDQGEVITEALDDWIAHGIAGDRLAGYVSVDPRSTTAVQFGAWAFGGLHLGIALPAAWQGLFERGQPWDIGPNLRGQWSPGSWGGHAVPVVMYDAVGVTVVTWGGLQRITWAGFHQYVDEAYACASWDWCVDATTPAGIAKADLLEYWQSIGGGPLPVPPGPPVPPVPPVPIAGVISFDLDKRTYSIPAGWVPATNTARK